MATTSITANVSSFPAASAARLAIVSIAAYQLLLILLIFLRPDLDPSWHTISEWAIGRYGWMMSGAFLLSGISYASLYICLRSQVRGWMGWMGSGLLLLCTIGAVGAGLCTTDPMPMRFPLSTQGILHVIFGSGQLVLLPFAALLINLSLARSGQWAKDRTLLFFSAGLPPVGFLSFVVYTALFVMPRGPDAYGPGVNIGWPPRVAFFTYMLWVVAVSLKAIENSHNPLSSQED